VSPAIAIRRPEHVPPFSPTVRLAILVIPRQFARSTRTVSVEHARSPIRLIAVRRALFYTCGSPGRHPSCPFSNGGADLQVGLAVTADSAHCSTMVAVLCARTFSTFVCLNTTVSPDSGCAGFASMNTR
jgi:hypothetical protein